MSACAGRWGRGRKATGGCQEVAERAGHAPRIRQCPWDPDRLPEMPLLPASLCSEEGTDVAFLVPHSLPPYTMRNPVVGDLSPSFFQSVLRESNDLGFPDQ